MNLPSGVLKRTLTELTPDLLSVTLAKIGMPFPTGCVRISPSGAFKVFTFTQCIVGGITSTFVFGNTSISTPRSAATWSEWNTLVPRIPLLGVAYVK